MKDKLKNAAVWVLVFVVLPLAVGWAAICYIGKLMKDSGKWRE